MSWIINYIFVDEDDQLLDERGYQDDMPAEEYGMHLMRKHNKVIGVYKEVVILDPVYENRDAELPLERNSDIRNPDSWTECPHCHLIHDPKLTRCWITGSS